MNEQHIRAYNPDGRFPSPDGPFNDASGSFELSDAMERLREASYREGSATWFGVRVTVTASGSATAEYNYDDEPRWFAPVDPVVYVRDQEKFPRDEDKQPEWLKQRLAEGRARISSQGNRVVLTRLDTGTPGRNWDNPSNVRNSGWNGRVVTGLQREYEFWRETSLAMEDVTGAMTAKRAQAPRELMHELDMAEGHVLAALRDRAAASESEIKRKLAAVVHTDPGDLSSLALSMNRCAESPLLGCVYAEPPQFGDPCLFCHLADR
jgi:hypothetical protein